jgi:5-methylcytosine-specific restriction endonuclease McrA
LKYECSACGLKDSWQDKKLVLQIEHKNGNRKDNRLKNLTFLCPNCHSQTETFAGRNRNKK